MIVYNTTFHVDGGIDAPFLAWVRSQYIPQAIQHGAVSQPRLTRVMVEAEGEGSSYSLQFEVASVADLQLWYEECGSQLSDQLATRFGAKVVGFTTLLEQLEITL